MPAAGPWADWSALLWGSPLTWPPERGQGQEHPRQGLPSLRAKRARRLARTCLCVPCRDRSSAALC
eukprot:bmy_13032T0